MSHILKIHSLGNGRVGVRFVTNTKDSWMECFAITTTRAEDLGMLVQVLSEEDASEEDAIEHLRL